MFFGLHLLMRLNRYVGNGMWVYAGVCVCVCVRMCAFCVCASVALRISRYPPSPFPCPSLAKRKSYFFLARPGRNSFVELARIIHLWVYTVYVQHFWQGNHHTYGHIRCVYTVLANPIRLPHASKSLKLMQRASRKYDALCARNNFLP